ncbi:unnamed protein product [Gadus morhua 'NCC']
MKEDSLTQCVEASVCVVNKAASRVAREMTTGGAHPTVAGVNEKRKEDHAGCVAGPSTWQPNHDDESLRKIYKRDGTPTTCLIHGLHSERRWNNW